MSSVYENKVLVQTLFTKRIDFSEVKWLLRNSMTSSPYQKNQIASNFIAYNCNLLSAFVSCKIVRLQTKIRMQIYQCFGHPRGFLYGNTTYLEHLRLNVRVSGHEMPSMLWRRNLQSAGSTELWIQLWKK